MSASQSPSQYSNNSQEFPDIASASQDPPYALASHSTKSPADPKHLEETKKAQRFP